MNKIQKIRGMSEIIPPHTVLWQQLEQIWWQNAHNFGYNEIKLPLLEATSLFQRSIGDETDIVAKEMFSFTSRDGEQISLRPEGTASCVRAGIEHGLFYNQTQRLWYQGPMFRYERPQKGRYRQFQQIGVEAFGFSDVAIEVELLALGTNFFKQLGILDNLTLEINTLGSKEDLQNYQSLLVGYLQQYADELDNDSKRRLHTNPLRIFDSKVKATQEILVNAPKLAASLAQESIQRFLKLQEALSALDITFKINPGLVRGLDYYSHTVFEWTTTQLGAQSAVAAGGRYNELVELLGGPNTPAAGFAIGIERAILLKEQINEAITKAHIYIIHEPELMVMAFKLRQDILNTFPKLTVIVDCNTASLKNQFKRADRSGATIALVLGSNEQACQTITVKLLREQGMQLTIAYNEIISFLQTKEHYYV